MAHKNDRQRKNGGPEEAFRPARDMEAAEEYPAADEVELDQDFRPADEVDFAGGAGDAELDFQEPLNRRDDQIGADDVRAPRDKNEDVEAAGEVTPIGPRVDFGRERDENREAGEDARTEGNGIGTISIILSILAFFVVPFLLGSAGIVLGIISARRGSRLGWWAVGIGAVAVILTAFIAPIAGF
ncbi:hypothetical protein [Paludifilum halophilum]|uniref:DUF4190 domain-containing protein n=1 Tax=Paludifilum halophilum TaxID=1642702 RepID=A0A235B5Y8_9BACL|nr:hypothetical protein [Paludifilum halophilum]OYD07718.1 hypothetical protein CHM34_09595 [Paludifilum halophilum]